MGRGLSTVTAAMRYAAIFAADRARRFYILLARLAEDTPTDSYRTTVFETIRKELGDAVELTNWPDVFTLGDGNQYDVERRSYEKAQTLLKDRNCDLLISGRVRGRSDQGTVLSMRFTVAEDKDGSPESYKLTETFDLPAAFVSRLGAAISARVILAAAPAAEMGGHFILPAMRSAAARIEPLVKRPNPAFDADTRGTLLRNYAVVLNVIGEQAGSNEELRAAIVNFRLALNELTRDRVPLDWAMTQNCLGTALTTLGLRESDTARLEEAVAAYREALKERVHAFVPLQWATTQNNLGVVLAALGERKGDAMLLGEAVAAFRDALKEWTRERMPLDWAATQNNLGIGLAILGKLEHGTAHLREAIAAFRDVLKEWTRERVPRDWAGTQNNLGTTLRILGERESGTVRLEQAVTAYREALTEWTRERVPLDWAGTHNNLGNTLRVLGERESGTARLEEAAIALKEALEVFEPAQAVYYIEGARGSLAIVDALIAQRKSKPN